MLILAFYLLWYQGKQQQELYEEAQRRESTHSLSNLEQNKTQTLIDNNFSEGLKNSSTDQPSSSNFEFESNFEEELFEGLISDSSSLIFTNEYGGIREVKLNRFSRLSRDYNMSHIGDPMLALSFTNEDGRVSMGMLSKQRKYKLIQKDEKSVALEWHLPGQFRITRHYERDDNSSYVFIHKTTFSNLSKTPLVLDRVKMQLGTAFRIDRLYNPFDNASTYLNVGYYNSGAPLAEGCSCAECSGRIDGEKDEFFQLNEMGVSGILETRRLTKAVWACVNNQFFVNLVRPATELSDVWINGSAVRSKNQQGQEIEGVRGSISFPIGILDVNETKEITFHVYAGPKDYSGLASLGHEQKKVMQFGVFWWVSEPLSWALNQLHGIFKSYGIAIIILTIVVKLLLWPLTAQATRSQKKMQSLQGPMAKLREKHKGNSQKLNQEMMKFYKEHKVNPFAGCWPILIQIPIFLGMFWMLRSAAELYGQNFLWATDLSEQDHVAKIQGFSINVLPILMVITQWFQMKLNPIQMGPELSDAQRINAKMMRFMPFMFLIFLYFFSSALVLYWTVQNLMTILQTLITKNKEVPLPEVQSRTELDNAVEKEESFPLSEKEKKYRNLLGLKSKGPIDEKLLRRNYEIRSKNYTDSKLDEMNPGKRRQALDKKDRLEQAFQFLLDSSKK